MSISDPIADMLTRIRNAQAVQKPVVLMPSSKVKVAIAKVLQDEGYIDSFEIKGEAAKPVLHIELKYYAGRPVIERNTTQAALLLSVLTVFLHQVYVSTKAATTFLK